MATATYSRAVFWWCLCGVALALAVGVSSVPTVSVEAAAEVTATTTTSAPDVEPPVAFFSEGPDHNPCAYPHDCRPGHILTTLECGGVGAEPVPGMDGRWYITAGGLPDEVDAECRPYVISHWDNPPPDGIAVCRLNHTLYQDGRVVEGLTISARAEGYFEVDLENVDNLVYEFVYRCTSANNPDFPLTKSTEWRQFYR